MKSPKCNTPIPDDILYASQKKAGVASMAKLSPEGRSEKKRKAARTSALVRRAKKYVESMKPKTVAEARSYYVAFWKNNKIRY